MKISAVITSVRYSDFLSHCLLFNKSFFDEIVVVTSHDDWHTKQCAKYHHVKAIESPAFSDKLNKGAAINDGIRALNSPDWICHLDADVLLPRRFREIIDNYPLDKTKIYGIDRMMCNSVEDYINFISEPRPSWEDDVFIDTNSFSLGERIAKKDFGGYIPIGFFQLWHSQEKKMYPTHHEDFARSDMLHSIQWSRDKRELIPEIVAIHLSTPDLTTMGTNWNGRKTRPFKILKSNAYTQ